MRTNLCNALVIQENSYTIANINLETMDTVQKITDNSNNNYYYLISDRVMHI